MRKLIILAISLAASLSAFGQIALVGHSYANSSAYYAAGPTSPAVNTVATNTSLEAACVTANVNIYTSQSVTDSCGNTLTWVADIQESNDSDVALFVKVNPIQCSSATISVNAGSAYLPSVQAMFFSGVASGPDQKSSATGFSSSAGTGSVTPTNNNELILSCISAQATSFAQVSPMTQ